MTFVRTKCFPTYFCEKISGLLSFEHSFILRTICVKCHGRVNKPPDTGRLELLHLIRDFFFDEMLPRASGIPTICSKWTLANYCSCMTRKITRQHNATHFYWAITFIALDNDRWVLSLVYEVTGNFYLRSNICVLHSNFRRIFAAHTHENLK